MCTFVKLCKYAISAPIRSVHRGLCSDSSCNTVAMHLHPQSLGTGGTGQKLTVVFVPEPRETRVGMDRVQNVWLPLSYQQNQINRHEKDSDRLQ